ncbi:MAG: HAD-IC family P-type ATPase [Actinobacteria bacterium]|nr:HAD-IC family P-type ATPase [Actinomycetota bacterium]
MSEPTDLGVAAPADAQDPGAPDHALDADEVAERLGVVVSDGLNSADVAERTERYGPNQLAEAPRRSAWLRFIDQFNNVLVYILLGAAAVSAAVGDFKDPIVIGIVLLINAILGYVQESRADDALAALKQMLEVVVRVRRDGAVKEVPAGALVPGDVVLLEAGDRIPADGRFVEAASVSVDESTLTGESVPVDKTVDPVHVEPGAEVPLAERSNCGYMNTTLSRGRAELVVTSTGMSTQVGRLAGLLGAAEETETPLQVQLDKLGKRLAIIAGVAVLAVLLVGLLQGDDLGDAVLSAVALAVAAIPEGLPAVVTVTLAIGVSRMAKERAIVKRLASVETLGSTTVICSDKTGTLTLNQMTATEAVAGGRHFRIEGLGYGSDGAVTPSDPSALADLQRAMVVGVLCNDAVVNESGGTAELIGDPTEGALVVASRKAGLDPTVVRDGAPRLDEVPFDSAVKYMATLHPGSEGGSLLAVKGAPDVVIDRCVSVRGEGGLSGELDDTQRAELLAANDRLGSSGLRVLALATRDLAHPPSEPVALALAEECEGLTLEALVGILDPARPEAVAAVAECRTAGVRVKMITGDHAATAGAIAAELGIVGEVVTGAELERMTDEELADRIHDIGVCARVSPEHKVRVVKALQSRGDVVAMTGDGVNDAPSLKQAEIGVAMGVTGTEVTKEAGDMILTDDNFATIVAAVERGRAIYDNIVTFVRFQLTTNIAAIITILAARLAGLPTPFNPIQILFVNILADGPPAMSLGLDPPKPGVMDRSPRDPAAKILTGPRLTRISITAVIMAVITLGVLWWQGGAESGVVPDQSAAYTVAFTLFVFLQIANAYVVRSGDLSLFSRFTFTNRPLLYATAAVIVTQVLVVEVPFLQGVFGTVGLTLTEWSICVGGALLLLAAEEVRSLVVRSASSSAA